MNESEFNWFDFSSVSLTTAEKRHLVEPVIQRSRTPNEADTQHKMSTLDYQNILSPVMRFAGDYDLFVIIPKGHIDLPFWLPNREARQWL